jgi:hypothetical protein
MAQLKKWFEKHAQLILVASLHVLAWTVYLTFFALAGANPDFKLKYRIWYVVSVAITDIPLFYFFYGYAVPRLLAGKRGWYFAILLLLMLGIYPFARFTLDGILIYYVEGYFSPFVGQLSTTSWAIYLIRALSGLFVIAMAGIGRFTFDWFKNARIRRELENQNLTSELAFLKSQINPHFLFNTLNNIHTLAYKKSDGAAESIMKLSELMRYMLYESDTQRVSLDTEIQHLKSFIGLQALRFKIDDIVDLEIEGDTVNRTIAPLILLPFVENAFKHGYNLKRSGAIRIRIKTHNHINVSVENEKPPVGQVIEKDEVGGIGLENISRRLELIYMSNYTLTIDDTSTHFKVNLTLR